MKSPLKVTGIDHVVLRVKNLDRAKKFYVGLLGMELKRENSWQAFVCCGSQMVGLFEVDQGEGGCGGHEVNHMALRLQRGEFADVKGILEEHGVEVGGRKGDPRCIYFSDPDGHRLQLLTPEEQ